MYPAPKNGALACVNIGGEDEMCAVMCKSEFDFASVPPLLYICQSGSWIFFSVFSYTPGPWPDCYGKIISKIDKLISDDPFPSDNTFFQ